MSQKTPLWPRRRFTHSPNTESVLETGLASYGNLQTIGCKKRHMHSRHCPKKVKPLTCVKQHQSQRACPHEAQYKYKGSRNLKPWLEPNGMSKTAPLPTDLFVWLRLNAVVISWQPLLFTLAVTIIWMVIINETSFIVPEETINSTALGLGIISFAVFFVANQLSGALGKRGSNYTGIKALVSAANNLMTSVKSGLKHGAVLINTKLELVSHNGRDYVRRSIYAHEVVGEIMLLLNAILFAQRNALRGDGGIDPELLPLETEHIDYIKTYQTVDPLVVMQGMIQTRLEDLAVAKLLKFETRPAHTTRDFADLVAQLGNLEIAAGSGPPRILGNLSTLLLGLLVLALPPWYSTFAPAGTTNYWPVLWVPLTVLFLFASVEIAKRMPNIFVSRADNIYSDVPVLEFIYNGAATNYEIYHNTLEEIEDTRTQFKSMSGPGNGVKPMPTMPDEQDE